MHMCIFLRDNFLKTDVASSNAFSNEMISHSNDLGICMVYWVFGLCNGTLNYYKIVWVQVEVCPWAMPSASLESHTTSLHGSVDATFFAFVWKN